MDERIGAFLGGDRQAGEELLLELLPRVRNVVRSLIGRDADVDDVAQQVMVEVIRSLNGFRGDCPLEGWADRITARVALAHARRSRARVLMEKPTSEPELEPGGTVVVLHPPGGEHYLEKREAVQLLDQLPVAQRTAVLLHHVLGFTVGEIASEEQASVETVRSRLRLGIEKLREGTRAGAAGTKERTAP